MRLLDPRLQARVARCIWQDIGEPEREPGDSSTIGRRDCDEWTFTVMHKLQQLGYEIAAVSLPVPAEETNK